MVKKAAQATPNRLLRAARKERDWTQQEVADRIGAPLVLNVSRWESGTTFPSAYYLQRLCQLFEKSPRELGLSQLGEEVAVAHSPALEPGQQIQPEPAAASRWGETRALHIPPSTSTALVQGSPNASLLTFRDTSLPLPLTPLIGREQDVATVCALLRRPDVRLLTLTGTGGIGKTRLALRAATDVRAVFADQIYFVSLAALDHAALVMPTIAQALGIKETDHRSFPNLLEEALREKQVLLLLDNFERLISAAPQVIDLLARCPQLTILVTSRAVLHIQGEYQFPVSPLSLPDQESVLDCQTLTQYAAVALFVQRAQAVRPDFHLTPANATIIAEICVRLDGLPLALELAAARLKLLSPQELLARLSNRLELLTGGPQDLPERQQTLRQTLQWSYQLLDDREQRLFQQLAVFVGGCTLEAAEAVCAPEGTHGSRAGPLDGIASLIDKSLLHTLQQEGEVSRLYLLETIREYGLECLAASGELEAIGRVHARYYFELVEKANFKLTGAQQAEWVGRLGREYTNLRAALQWCLDHEECSLTMDLATALADFWLQHGPVSEGHVFLERALAKGGAATTPERARATAALGWLVCAKGDFDQAEHWCSQSLALFSKLGELHGIALMLCRLGSISLYKGDSDRAQQLLEEGLARFRTMEDVLGTSGGLYELAHVSLTQGDYARARQQLEESLALYRKADAPSGVANALYLLGSTTFQQGDLLLAQTLFDESLALCRTFHHKRGISSALVGQGMVALVQGEYVRAQTLFEEGLTLARSGGWQDQMDWGTYGLGWVAFNQRDYSTARSCFEEGLAFCRVAGNQIIVTYYLEGLATVALAQDQATWAAQLWGAAERVHRMTNIAVPPVLRRINEQLVTNLQVRLGEAALTTILGQEYMLTLDEVLRQGEPAMRPGSDIDWSHNPYGPGVSFLLEKSNNPRCRAL